VQALVDDLDARLDGHAIARFEVAAFSALKTFDPQPTAVHGLLVDAVRRHGKFLDIEASGLHLVMHLARGGWVRWRDQIPPKPLRPGKGPLAARVVLDDDSGFDVTEAGTQKRLALYVVDSVEKVPGIARLGPDPLSDEFTLERLRAILAQAGRTQLKGTLRDQAVIAGIGNAYSDEVLHAAKMSPYRSSSTLDDGDVEVLYAAIRDVLGDAISRSHGIAASELKAEKKTGLRVHGRAGEECPVCGDTIREVSFADRAMQYCPTCQTGGKPLADRRMSRLLK
jgi:formamidopyrimidine-DNA glycosylase